MFWVLVIALALAGCSKDDFSTDQVRYEEQMTISDPGDFTFRPPGDLVRAPLRTQTQEDWGALPDEHAAAAYLHERFDLVFGPLGIRGPEGLVIGFRDVTRVFNSAEAITRFLPQGLPPDRRRPGPDVFGGELMALSLNVYFDDVFRDFGRASYSLRDMVVRDEKVYYDGWTVGALLKIANEVYGGALPSVEVGELYSVIKAINHNYRDGQVDQGYLVCPPPATYRVLPPDQPQAQ